MRALYTAATGMAAQELNVQVISNNIANLRTTGYKRQRAQFQDLLYETLRRARHGDVGPEHAWCPRASQIGSGVKTASTGPRHVPGHADADGEGIRRRHPRRRLLPVQMPDGRTAYTRDGSFELDAHRASSSPMTATSSTPPSRSRRTPRASRSAPSGQVQASASPARPRRRRWAKSSSRASSTRPASSRSATTSSSRRRRPARP